MSANQRVMVGNLLVVVTLGLTGIWAFWAFALAKYGGMVVEESTILTNGRPSEQVQNALSDIRPKVGRASRAMIRQVVLGSCLISVVQLVVIVLLQRWHANAAGEMCNAEDTQRPRRGEGASGPSTL